jgi:integrase
MNDEWMKDKAVQNWFESIGLHKTRTLRNYKRQFPRFLKWLKSKYPQFKTPSDIIKHKEKAKKHEWESIVVRFKNYIETQVNPKTNERLRIPSIRSYVKCVQSFFSHNDEKLSFRRGELKIEPSEAEKVARKWVPENPEIRHLYRCAKGPRDRALILVLYQSGFSPVDVASMKIEDFPLVSNGKWSPSLETHLYHCRRREKTDIWRARGECSVPKYWNTLKPTEMHRQTAKIKDRTNQRDFKLLHLKLNPSYSIG